MLILVVGNRSQEITAISEVSETEGCIQTIYNRDGTCESKPLSFPDKDSAEAFIKENILSLSQFGYKRNDFEIVEE
jgi:hypothetical protein